MISAIQSKWDATFASSLTEVELLVYASNLLGADERITNFGGGNTSSKITEADPLTGDPVEVLWVKASGGDLGTAKKANFASLYQQRVLGIEALLKEKALGEDDAVDLYKHCIFNLNPAAPSIDTPLHALVPARCVSHMHSDAVIAIAANESDEALCKEVFGDEMGYLPWKRPGFDLGVMLRGLIAANPGINGALMGSHGFICWAEDWESCYELTVKFINDAQRFLDGGRSEPFGSSVRPTKEPNAESLLADWLPVIRGMAHHEGKGLIATVDGDPVVLDFLSREHAARLCNLGTSCPDHFLRTKIRPLLLPDVAPQSGWLDGPFARFRDSYGEYYAQCKNSKSPPMRNPNPTVVLWPGVGMISLGKNKQESIVTGKFFRNAIEVMRGAEAVGRYRALPEQEAFDIEYWALEEAKLRRMPPEKPFDRKVALITGGAQGIGRATAERLVSDGACVVLLDIQEDKLAEAKKELEGAARVPGSVLTCVCDVTSADAVADAVKAAIREFGGIDLGVFCAGNARRGTVAETSDVDYAFQSDLLMKGYFLAMRAVSQTMIRQGTGGAMVVVASKNAVAAGANAAVYSAAKAFELHLMRSTALDLAPYGIRCNAINPDAVLEGSAIWSGEWRAQTAKNLGIAEDELEEHYRKRSLLGVTVSTADCAKAICWLLSEEASRTTGCTIPVDGGNKEGFLR